MVYTRLYCYRNGYVKLLSAVSVLIMGPWVGCQLMILIEHGNYFNEDYNLIASTSLYCVVYFLCIALLAYPERKVKFLDNLFVLVG